MPGFNNKGPLGNGPMTGRAMGKCNPRSRFNMEGHVESNKTGEVEKSGQNIVFRGRGFGMGGRWGKGFGIGFRSQGQ